MIPNHKALYKCSGGNVALGKRAGLRFPWIGFMTKLYPTWYKTPEFRFSVLNLIQITTHNEWNPIGVKFWIIGSPSWLDFFRMPKTTARGSQYDTVVWFHGFNHYIFRIHVANRDIAQSASWVLWRICSKHLEHLLSSAVMNVVDSGFNKDLHPAKLTWLAGKPTVKEMEMYLLSKMVIFRCYVNFQGLILTKIIWKSTWIDDFMVFFTATRPPCHPDQLGKLDLPRPTCKTPSWDDACYYGLIFFESTSEPVPKKNRTWYNLLLVILLN